MRIVIVDDAADPEFSMSSPTGAEPSIAGHAYSVEGMAGGMLSLRISLQDAALVDLARKLSKLGGVRVTSGPAIVSRGDCYLVHCPGFKMVLSSPDPADDFAQALLSRTIEPALAITCELASLFARLMSSPPPRPAKDRSRERESAAVSADRPQWHKMSTTTSTMSSTMTSTSTLRRTALQPGKTLARKTPLSRKTPLARGRRPWPLRRPV